MTTAPGGIRDAVDAASIRRMRRAARRRGAVFILTAVLAFAADQLTKLAVRAGIDVGERIDLLPGVDLVRARNEGIAFGLFPGRQTLVAVLTALALCVIGATLATVARRHTGVLAGGGLLIGGSIGNLVDRLAHGGVTDFVSIGPWPAFNVADVAIVVGALLVAFGLTATRDTRE